MFGCWRISNQNDHGNQGWRKHILDMVVVSGMEHDVLLGGMSVKKTRGRPITRHCNGL